jgi:Flp pilus assembly protein TadG
MTVRWGRGIGVDARAQALVEFALVFPIFLLLLFGLIDVARFVYLNNAFNEAAREAARYGSVEQWQYGCPPGVSPVDRIECTRQIARDRIAGAPADPLVDVSCTTQQCRAGDLLTVRVYTPQTGQDAFRFLTPIVGQLIPGPVVSGQTQVMIQ